MALLQKVAPYKITELLVFFTFVFAQLSRSNQNNSSMYLCNHHVCNYLYPLCPILDKNAEYAKKALTLTSVTFILPFWQKNGKFSTLWKE